jgi:hypothetical protein
VGSDANRGWYEQQQGGQSSSFPQEQGGDWVIDIKDEYPFSQSLRDTALSPTPSIATSAFTNISYSEATTGFSMPHFTASVSGSDAAAPRLTSPEPMTPDSMVFVRAADQLVAALEEDIHTAELRATER